MTDLQKRLFALRDEQYQAFQQRLVPNIPPEKIIGVRTPQLRKLVRELEPAFLTKLPHDYFEENQLHVFALEKIGDFNGAIAAVEHFLPYIDNWATCDQLRPKCFRQGREALLPYIRKWLSAEHPYTVRFAIEMLLIHYLDEAFEPDYPKWVSQVQSEEYYVRMMCAWYFATALAYQYETVLPYVIEARLDPWIHNKTIQKAIESHRLSAVQKAVLRKYKI